MQPMPDVQLLPPPDDQLIRVWFRDFESTFCILHPFLKAEDWSATGFDTDEGPDRQQVHHLQAVRWCQIVQSLGLDNLAELNAMLLTSIGALRVVSKNRLEDLNSVLKEKGLRAPDEGDIPGVLLDKILRSFLSVGYENCIVRDEFGKKREPHEIHELLALEYPTLGVAHTGLYSPDGRLLYSTHWDSFYTMLCGELRTVEQIVSRFGFEGFFADDTTTVFWLQVPTRCL